MDEYRLRYFIAIAEKKSITRAAEALSISQQALSKLVQQLEQEMGVPLLERRRNGVALTEYGQEFLVYAMSVVARHDRLVSRFHSIQTANKEGVFFAYATGMLSHFLPPMIISFMEQHPEVNFRLSSYSDDPYNRGALEAPHLLLASSPPPDPNWTVVAERHLPMAIMMAKDHPLAEQSSVCWADLLGYPFFHLNIDNIMSRRLQQEYDRHGLQPAYILNASEHDLTHALMQSRQALAFFAGNAEVQHVSDWAVTRPLADCDILMDYYLLANQRTPLGPTEKQMVKTIRQELERL